MNLTNYRYSVDYLTRYTDFNPLLLFAQKYEFVRGEQSPMRACYANAVILLEEGQGILRIDEAEHHVQAGTMVYIGAGIPHQWHSSAKDRMHQRCVYFDWKYVSRPGFHYQKDYFVPLDQPFSEQFSGAWSSLKPQTLMKVDNLNFWLSSYNAFTQPPSLLDKRSPIESLQFNAAFQSFLFHYLSIAVIRDGFGDPRIAKILERIDVTASQQSEPLIYEYAREFHLGKSRFHQLFKEATGHTPNGYLQVRKLRQAAEDLRVTDMTVTEIAHKYSYSSIHYFSRAFRNTLGVSPSQYRAMCIK